MNKKEHFYLVVGEIHHLDSDGNAGISVHNAVIHNDLGCIPVREIGRAQQAVQLQFFKQVNDSRFQVRNVIIQNLCYLGFMTPDEFQAAPEGMKLQEQAAKSPTGTVN